MPPRRAAGQGGPEAPREPPQAYMAINGMDAEHLAIYAESINAVAVVEGIEFGFHKEVVAQQSKVSTADACCRRRWPLCRRRRCWPSFRADYVLFLPKLCCGAVSGQDAVGRGRRMYWPQVANATWQAQAQRG